VTSGGDINTDAVGPHSFKVEATDKAGNVYSESSIYKVIYDFGGFLPPIKAPPTLNVTVAGNAVLVQFSLGGDQGMDIFAEDDPDWQKIKCESQDLVNVIEQSDLQHTAGADHYTFGWNTDET
jgi:hypothetical protein